MSVTVVGLGADGWPGLAPPARTALEKAAVVLGAPRQLDLLPDTVTAHRESWPSPLMPALPGLLERHARDELVVLASGDPMFFGIGSAVLRLRPDAAVVAHPSSLALAAARLGWAEQDVVAVSAVGRPLAAVRAALAPGRRVLVLADSTETPARLAALLVGAGYGAARLSVLTSLGAEHEARADGTAADWHAPTTDPLAVVAVTCPALPDDDLLGRAPGLPDSAYSHDGQLTKAELRALSVAALRPLPGQLLWDVGGGAGSIGIEWCRAEPSARAIAIETRADRAARIAANAETLGAAGLRVVEGDAPEVLAGMEAPDAVFVGGGVSVPGMLDTCRTALRAGGRLVANAVTVEGEAALAAARAEHGGSIRRIAVSRAAPVGRYLGWKAMAPVTQWIFWAGRDGVSGVASQTLDVRKSTPSTTPPWRTP
ncbi:precorrin-6y C5,15-methyltransferase (decarboxylating) subunit CbiE [Actinomycetospora sp. TBRC 11914]|uniref:precorrin-6y C5,15-methyltransferase (decarboxylating) subunit CbiE n=1 Tax=Actinomycetospora sp. TBRC 11914 TaxID=2729387 RepID=UPI00145C9959|nr:precorrin-6y C5,15-methyltransferase (decarboxylating) subunit CbiE [Actinomycetospora sp. TBRC 11914]NMO92413.1 precorrin-6y C5,15-methyltransferase (decarboxylating) subunit CbiE [Actinomycetospora sp. TBRC 11914]